MQAPFSRPLIWLGTVQGALLYWLFEANKQQLWPSTALIWQGALIWLVLAVPAAIYMTAGTDMPKRRRTPAIVCALTLRYDHFPEAK